MRGVAYPEPSWVVPVTDGGALCLDVHVAGGGQPGPAEPEAGVIEALQACDDRDITIPPELPTEETSV